VLFVAGANIHTKSNFACDNCHSIAVAGRPNERSCDTVGDNDTVSDLIQIWHWFCFHYRDGVGGRCL
jgi:hypothetical protein